MVPPESNSAEREEGRGPETEEARRHIIRAGRRLGRTESMIRELERLGYVYQHAPYTPLHMTEEEREALKNLVSVCDEMLSRIRALEDVASMIAYCPGCGLSGIRQGPKGPSICTNKNCHRVNKRVFPVEKDLGSRNPSPSSRIEALTEALGQ